MKRPPILKPLISLIAFSCGLGFSPFSSAQDLEYSPYDGRPVHVLWDDSWATESIISDTIVDSSSTNPSEPTLATSDRPKNSICCRLAEITDQITALSEEMKELSQEHNSAADDSFSKLKHSMDEQHELIAQFMSGQDNSDDEADENSNQTLAKIVTAMDRQESLLQEVKEAHLAAYQPKKDAGNSLSALTDAFKKQQETLAQIRSSQEALASTTTEEAGKDGNEPSSMEATLSQILHELASLKANVAENDKHLSAILGQRTSLSNEGQSIAGSAQESDSAMDGGKEAEPHSFQHSHEEIPPNPKTEEVESAASSPTEEHIVDNHANDKNGKQPATSWFGSVPSKNAQTTDDHAVVEDGMGTDKATASNDLREMFERIQKRSKELDE